MGNLLKPPKNVKDDLPPPLPKRKSGDNVAYVLLYSSEWDSRMWMCKNAEKRKTF